jgi:hypothetical protein
MQLDELVWSLLESSSELVVEPPGPRKTTLRIVVTLKLRLMKTRWYCDDA